MDPTLDIHWLAGSPACDVLARVGEKFAPEQINYRGDSEIAESVSHNCSLNLTTYAFSAMQAWLHNAHVSQLAASQGGYDIVVGDETYEIMVANLMGLYKLPPIPFLIIYDFLGMDITSRNQFEKIGAWVLNFLWSNGWRVTSPDHNRAIFIGELEDIADKPFGFLLTNRRQYAKKYIEFVGYSLPFDVRDIPPKNILKRELGYADEPLIICSVGGMSIGKSLLELCGQAYPIIADHVPDVHMVIVAGPRIDPKTLDLPEGIDCRGMVPELWRHLAACDMAILQGGGTTTLEAEVLRIPFIFFPLEGQAEQELVVAKRLARHRAGVRMQFSSTTPEELADKVVSMLNVPVNYSEIPTDGACLAAKLILERAGINVSD